VSSDNIFFRNGGALKVQTAPTTKPPTRRIIHEICTNKSEAFAGFGRHTANDLLYLAVMFPGTPAHIICQDSERYEKFKDLIYTYQSQFADPEFHRFISTSPNTDNPFAFNENSNRIYMERYIEVFRRTTALVPKLLYHQYQTQGLLDPDHILGTFWSSFNVLFPLTTELQASHMFQPCRSNLIIVPKSQ
jgi:hypothetical protein